MNVKILLKYMYISNSHNKCIEILYNVLPSQVISHPLAHCNFLFFSFFLFVSLFLCFFVSFFFLSSLFLCFFVCLFLSFFLSSFSFFLLSFLVQSILIAAALNLLLLFFPPSPLPFPYCFSYCISFHNI